MSRLLRGAAARSVGSTHLPGRTAPRPPAPGAPARAQGAAVEPTVHDGPSHEALVAQALADARAEIDALRERARAEGLDTGRRQARREVDAALDEQGAACRSAIAAMHEALAAKFDEFERFAVAIAFEACATVLGEGAANGATVTAVVRRLLAQARESIALRVQLPPSDLEAVRRALEGDPHWQHRALAFEADPALQPGECRIASAHGRLETGLDVQLHAVREALLAAHLEARRDRSTRP